MNAVRAGRAWLAAWCLLAVAPAPAATATVAAAQPSASLGDLVEAYLVLAGSSQAQWLQKRCADADRDDRCDPVASELGALYSSLSARTRRFAADTALLAGLTDRERLGLDFLLWRIDEGVAAYSEPDTTRYQRLLLRHTSLRLAPDQLHRLGLDEVSRIRGEMQQWVRDVAADRGGHANRLRAFLDAARDDPRLYAASRADLVAEANGIAQRAQARLPRIFAELPRTPLRIVTPREIAGGVMARYGGTAGQAGIVALNPDPRHVPLYVLEALILHEGMPGHHLQIALAADLGDRPDWWGDLAPTAYVEGWGLYAESLGDEIDLYRHPMREFGRMTLEMWRALRLVIDTGLHAFDWDQQQALDLFLDNTALPRAQALVEVQRYRDNPGQAVAYKVGELHLKALRERAESALGEAFDLAAFHTLVLRHGPVPLAALDRQVDQWLAGQTAN